MGILSIFFLISLALAVVNARQIFSGKSVNQNKINLVKSFGLLAMVTGIFGQLLGLFDAFSAIEQMGAVSPAMLAGGLRVSMITTLYGVTIFIVSYLIWAGLNWKNMQNSNG